MQVKSESFVIAFERQFRGGRVFVNFIAAHSVERVTVQALIRHLQILPRL